MDSNHHIMCSVYSKEKCTDEKPRLNGAQVTVYAKSYAEAEKFAKLYFKPICDVIVREMRAVDY